VQLVIEMEMAFITREATPLAVGGVLVSGFGFQVSD